MMDDDALTDLWRIRDAFGDSSGRLKYPLIIVRARVDRRDAAVAGLDSGNLRMTILEADDLLDVATPAAMSARAKASAP